MKKLHTVLTGVLLVVLAVVSIPVEARRRVDLSLDLKFHWQMDE